MTLKGDSTAESHAREFLAESSCFGWIRRFLETVREFKERGSPLFVRHDRIRQEIDDCTVPGNVPTRCDSINLLSHLGGERNTPSDGFRSCESRFHVHQDTPTYTKLQVGLSRDRPLVETGMALSANRYLAILALSWQNIVLGDPLCSLGKPWRGGFRYARWTARWNTRYDQPSRVDL